ncbi:TPA: RHS repeat-associated core domain-containing protein [Vibrio parahaemolyticus]|nr:RHS repeat-associated core domain-containing protein [Vibrio parahaemolyticus]HCG9871322.1 RHS repeat-associated core domain-containing protein [Vibrio parahaemolyticus]
MLLGYSPFGQVYRKHNDKTQWKINAGVNANKQLGQLMPYQYTGGYTDGNTGLVHLDARWYNPHTSRFVQPDYWNLKNTYLPSEIQHELMRFTGLNASQLLRDPSQQLAYGYVSGNPLVWVDPMGLSWGIYDYDVQQSYPGTPITSKDLHNASEVFGDLSLLAGTLAVGIPFTSPVTGPIALLSGNASIQLKVIAIAQEDEVAKTATVEYLSAVASHYGVKPLKTLQNTVENPVYKGGLEAVSGVISNFFGKVLTSDNQKTGSNIPSPEVDCGS